MERGGGSIFTVFLRTSFMDDPEVDGRGRTRRL